MKVSELIELLKQCDPSMPVLAYTDEDSFSVISLVESEDSAWIKLEK